MGCLNPKQQRNEREKKVKILDKVSSHKKKQSEEVGSTGQYSKNNSINIRKMILKNQASQIWTSWT